MFFYLIHFFLFSIFSYIYSITKEQYSKFLFKTICFLILFIPSALRYNIGYDYKNYVEIFNQIGNGVKINQETGWLIINKIILYFHLDVQWIFVIASFFTIYYIFKTPKKDFFVTTLLFYCLWYLDSYNIVRQGLSMSICWYSYLLYTDNKKGKSYLYAFIAILFHLSSVIFLIFLFIANYIKVPNKTFSIVVFILLYVILESIDLIQSLGLIFEHTKYGTYFKFFEQYNNLSKNYGSNISLLLRLIILTVMYFVYKPRNKNNEQIVFIITICLFSFDIIGAQIYMFQRIRLFFFITYISLITNIISTKNGILLVEKYIFIFFIILYYLVLRLMTGTNAIIPYQSIFLR